VVKTNNQRTSGKEIWRRSRGENVKKKDGGGSMKEEGWKLVAYDQK